MTQMSLCIDFQVLTPGHLPPSEERQNNSANYTTPIWEVETDGHC